jgi:hypothetical protein
MEGAGSGDSDLISIRGSLGFSSRVGLHRDTLIFWSAEHVITLAAKAGQDSKNMPGSFPLIGLGFPLRRGKLNR